MLRKITFLLFLQSVLHAQTATVDGTAGGASDSVDVTIIVDSDRDGLTDAQEATLGTDPSNPDTDGDGLTDKAEVDAGKTHWSSSLPRMRTGPSLLLSSLASHALSGILRFSTKAPSASPVERMVIWRPPFLRHKPMRFGIRLMAC